MKHAPSGTDKQTLTVTASLKIQKYGNCNGTDSNVFVTFQNQNVASVPIPLKL